MSLVPIDIVSPVDRMNRWNSGVTISIGREPALILWFKTLNMWMCRRKLGLMIIMWLPSLRWERAIRPIMRRYFIRSSNVPEVEQPLLPDHFALHQNYPNPFNPMTTIPFDLPTDGFVSLQVFNILGQRVATVVNQPLHAGFHRVIWNGSSLSSGIYFYRITVQSNGELVFKELRKAVMIR